NRERHRIEMHLASAKRQKVRVCGETIDFRAGETIHTENSYKYSVQSFGALARGSSWMPAGLWTDAKAYFSVQALKCGGKNRRAALAAHLHFLFQRRFKIRIVPARIPRICVFGAPLPKFVKHEPFFWLRTGHPLDQCRRLRQ